jgi:hypothetical protein
MKWGAMMSDDPWSDLRVPNASDAINAKRVDPALRWGFFWARGVDRKCLLVLKHPGSASPRGRLPRLKGIEIALTDADHGDERMLVLRLLDSAQRDIFYRLCRDIISGAEGATTEKEAVETTLARTWRWHHLLRGGGDGRLSPEEQKGVIGELFVMETFLLPHLPAIDAVHSWRGPLGAPKDFEVGRLCIEAKARRGASTPYIAISSEHQLDDSGTDALFLYVAELDRAPSDSDDGFSISIIAGRVRDAVGHGDNAAIDLFETAILASGFRWEDDYSADLWVAGPSRIYTATGSFPRIVAQSVATGVSNVKYSIALSECEPFLVAPEALEEALRRGRHAA